MSAQLKLSSADDRLHQVFGAPVGDLYTAAIRPDASPALSRALELRSSLALAEEQVARVRDRVREAMVADRDMDELSAEDLRMDAQWLEAELDARDGYRAALDDLLRTMPPPGQRARAVRTAQPTLAPALPPAVAAPAPLSAGAARARRL
ncbi:hypothetical protein [Streptomyces diastatochromogenes]|uniref:Uncharacterized protein n=1 Tax=Streptomyces diastatochromogenes TaxID=42236 RepID=A0A233SCR4_STRDA|nr:hypothetical protein [Streptomyces diastatochromogenes]OXY93456.1 hypothetical protein BEK98_22355 [Streptomyces diastatochromogenes]